MRTAIGVVLMLAGLAFGLYVGVWLCFVGGIVQIFESFQAVPIDAVGVGLGALRIMVTGVAGVVTAVVAIFPGYAMVVTD